VYAITDRGNMYAIDVEAGQERWIAGGIRSYVAGNADRLYVVDTRGNLTILDVATGSRIGTLITTRIDQPYMNVQTDRLILASSSGLIQCLRQADLKFPVVLNMGELKPPEEKKTPIPTPTPTPAPGGAAPMPEGGDPFGADPFADPPAKPAAPGAAPAEAEDDPFGM
jgi:hypothetical protein